MRCPAGESAEQQRDQEAAECGEERRGDETGPEAVPDRLRLREVMQRLLIRDEEGGHAREPREPADQHEEAGHRCRRTLAGTGSHPWKRQVPRT